jgi:hypothetical protein
MKAFQDIMSSGVLWATDVRYMNDASELTYGLKLVEEEISGLQKEAEELAVLLQGVQSRLSYSRCFVFSLSENRDDLPQWTAYGGRFGGLAIGFETSGNVGDGGSSDAKMEDVLVNIVYDTNLQKSSVQVLLQKALSIYRKIRQDGVRSIGDFTGFVANVLFQHLIRLKHPCFRHEAEWRLVVASLLDDKEIDYHSNATGLIPHVTFKIVARTDLLYKRMPIRIIVQGPTADSHLAKEALLGFLRRKGYQGTEVLVSDIPLRF